MPKKKSVWYHELSWPEIVQKSKECDIILLPVGSDSLNAQKMAERVAEKTGTLAAPPIWYGASMYMQYGFPGTVPIGSDALKGFAKDVITGLVKVFDLAKYCLTNLSLKYRRHVKTQNVRGCYCP